MHISNQIVPVYATDADGNNGILTPQTGSTHVSFVEDINGKERVVLKLKPHLSPIKAAVIPLKKNDENLVTMAKNIKNTHSVSAPECGAILVQVLTCDECHDF